jgi:hypothetical protein
VDVGLPHADTAPLGYFCASHEELVFKHAIISHARANPE